MANLQQIMAETSKSYDNSRKALQNQINAISGDLKAEQGRINAQYAQQSKNLDNQRNWQAQASSMSASRNGGSFGGRKQKKMLTNFAERVIILKHVCESVGMVDKHV